jgi:hypothetical protein
MPLGCEGLVCQLRRCLVLCRLHGSGGEVQGV